jgi:DNA-binding CsgD family transcriptional regulator
MKIETLTNQEIRVLRLSAEGYSCKQIGEALGIAASTAQRHRKNIIKKMGLSGQTDFRRWLHSPDVATWLSNQPNNG